MRAAQLQAAKARYVGQRFGRLTGLKYIPSSIKTNTRQAYVICQCDCGRMATVPTHSLPTGHASSCGCVQKERVRQTGFANTTHGMSKTSEYSTWTEMKSRCYNQNDKQFTQWGGRGITVCQRWRNSFTHFINDMGLRPNGLSLERIDNDKGYWCGNCNDCIANHQLPNCKWATVKEQANNRRSNRHMTMNGRTQSVAAWSDEIGISRSLLQWRLNHGWSDIRSLTTPVRAQHRTR